MTTASLATDPLRKGALKALREGRVRICSVGYDGGRKAVTAAAEVHGHSGVHQVSYMSDRWACSCGSAGPCAHVRAVQQVTGHAGAPSHPDAGREQGPDPALLATLLQRPGWVAARFSGHCSRCDRPWRPGAPITCVRDRWVGACCLRDLDLPT